VVTHQLQVERSTAKARRPKGDVLPLDHPTNLMYPATGKVSIVVGVALAMRHRLKWFIHLRAQGLSKRDEQPINSPYGVQYSLPFTYVLL